MKLEAFCRYKQLGDWRAIASNKSCVGELSGRFSDPCAAKLFSFLCHSVAVGRWASPVGPSEPVGLCEHMTRGCEHMTRGHMCCFGLFLSVALIV